MQNLVTVDFRGDTLFAVEREGGVFVAVKPISDRLGLDWNGQVQRIKRDPVLHEGTCVIHVPSPGGVQETFCLALRLVNGWLFGIDVARVKPDLREHVLAYKRECYETLADRFLGPRAAEAPIVVTAVPAETIEDRSLREREHKEKLVGRMLQMKGPDHAFALYQSFGFPVVAPPAVALAADRPDAFAAEPAAVAMHALACDHPGWTGTADELLTALQPYADADMRASRRWPASAQGLGSAIGRVKALLSRRGVIVTRRHSGIRTITLTLAGTAE